MTLQHAPLVAMNRGEVSKLALARVDLERLRLSAEDQINWLPRTLGPMTMRPGWQYLASTRGDAAVEVIPFVFATFDTAAIEVSDGFVRVLVNDAPISRVAVSTAFTNGTFTVAGGAEWTLATTGGASATISGDGFLRMSCPARGGRATATQALTIASGDQGKEHGLRAVITRGPVTLRIGTTSGGEEILARTVIDTGTHSLAFTPPAATGTVYVQMETTQQRQVTIDSVLIETAGVMELPGPWTAADLPYLRYEQSADVVFVADGAHQQRRIERRGVRSWSVATYKTADGPFQAGPSIPQVLVTPSGTTGDITLTASAPLWSAKSVGQLLRLLSQSQNFSNSLAAQNTFTSAIRIFGVQATRQFTVAISGTWAGTLQLQRSFDGPDVGFVDVTTFTNGTTSWTANTAAQGITEPTDGFDNQAVWYRIGFKTGAFTSGSATIALSYPGGGGAGIVRITGFTSTTSVAAEVLTDLKSTVATSDWREGEWSDKNGWPSAVTIYDGRMWWFGKDREWGSVSDAYDSWSLDQVGDAGPIQRSIGRGPVDYVSWALPLQRLIIGTGAAEISVRSSSFDEPLTPTNFGQKDCSTQGSAPIGAVKMDGRGIYVQRSSQRVFELSYELQQQDYSSKDLTQLRPDIAGGLDTSAILKIAVQRQPDTRIHAILSTGQVGILTYEPDEEVICWWRAESPTAGGVIENVYVLPGAIEDRVYYIVRRTINGVTRRFHERQAREGQCYGLPEARLADAHIIYSGAATTTITGLSHLEGQTVVVWGFNTVSPFTVTMPDGTVKTVGRDLGTKVVTGGQITGLSSAVTDACVGLAYQAKFKSAKLAYGGALGTALNQRKKLGHLGLVLAYTHCQGITYGPDYAHLSAMPQVERGATVDQNTIWTDYDADMMPTGGNWTTDSRLCIVGNSPRPATVLGAVVEVDTHDKT